MCGKRGLGDTHEGVSKVRPMQQENQDVERKNWSYWCGPPCLVYLIRDVSYRDGMVMFQRCSAYRNLVYRHLQTSMSHMFHQVPYPQGWSLMFCFASWVLITIRLPVPSFSTGTGSSHQRHSVPVCVVFLTDRPEQQLSRCSHCAK